MTTADTAGRTGTPKAGKHFRFPDPPEREPDDMTSFDQLTPNGNAHHLVQHLGNQDTTLVAGEHYLAVAPTRDMTGVRYPDLLVAFGVDPAAYYRSNAYVISEQGKPPDFVLEIASPSSRKTDRVDKRREYAELGITEYWRFDEKAVRRELRLAGDRLVNGRYEPIPIEELEDGVLQGYSEALNLYLRWEQGQLRLHDPATGRHILTYDDQRARADREREARAAAEAQRNAEREARIEERRARAVAEAQRNAEREARIEEREARASAEAQRNAEREARLAAEARVRELEAENQQLRKG